jgi:hypothetical protein
MKHQFKKEEVDFGCYFEPENCVDRRHEFPESMEIQEILNLEIPVEHKFWFVFKNCDLTTKEKQILNLNCAKVNLFQYKSECKKNGWFEKKEVAELIGICEQYTNGVISLSEFNEKRNANTHAYANDYDYAYAYANTHAYAIAIANDYDYANAYAIANAYAYAYANTHAYANDYDYALLDMLKKFIEKPEIIQI